MRSVLAWGKRDEILDLTAPAHDGEGIVARWLRDSLAESIEPASGPRAPAEEPAV